MFSSELFSVPVIVGRTIWVKMSDPEEIVMEVLQGLPGLDANKLLEVCGILSLPVPEERQGKRSLINLIMRFLNGEDLEKEADNGHSTFLTLHSVLYPDKNETGDDAKIKHEPETEPRDVKKQETFEKAKLDTKSKVKLQRLREFKITGTIGATDQKDNLKYTSLSFQMEKGKKAGYSVGEIQTAVVKAIKPESSLRMYLESKVDISEQAFIQILRSHFKEKDSTSVFQEMSNSVQLPSESELDYCLRVMSLREKVMTLSREEASPFDEAMVRKRFFHAIFTGLKHNSVRV